MTKQEQTDIIFSMPIAQSGSTDNFSSMIRFRRSEVWEFLISLDAACHTWLFESWTEKVEKALGPDFLKKYQQTSSFIIRNSYELAIDAPEHSSIENFFHYVEELSEEDFIFYSFGRIIPRKQITLPLNPSKLQAFLEEAKSDNWSNCHIITGDPFSWVKAPKKKKSELLSIWRTYYEQFYKHQHRDFSEEYTARFREWEQILEKEGGRALYNYVRQNDWFPAPLPPDQEYTEIEIIPVHFLPQNQRTYYGYGKIAILSQSLRTMESKQDFNNLKNDLVLQLKALGDSSRLDILRTIVEYEYDINGKGIAKRLNISPSVVSRHLKQLKSAGIIEEKTEDNRNFTYGISRDSVLRINRNLLFFLTEKKV